MPSKTDPDAGHPLPGATILLVDDELAVRRMLVDLLRTRGFRVAEAGDATAAFQLAAAWAPAGPRLLITDLRLPGASGLELAGQLRKSYPEMGVVFMSGFAEDLMADPAGIGPRCRILEKPFRTTRLIELVSQLLA